jgi:RNA polymerase sigma factor (sigma-70 family)
MIDSTAATISPGPVLLPTAKPPVNSLIDALPVSDQVLLTKLLTEPADFVDHPDFDKSRVERMLYRNEARLTARDATRFLESADEISDAIASGERVPALSYDQERHLFMRFNYARMQALRILGEFAGERLTAAATRRLLAWGHRALAARSIIVRLNMPLVLAMAKRTRLTNVDFNEMVSEGNMALLRSVEKFDCSRGYKFSTYSCRAILKAFSRVAMRASRYRGQFPAEFDPAMERSDYIEQQRETLEGDCVDELKEILLNNLAELSEVESTVIRERFALVPSPDGQMSPPKTLEQVGTIIGVTKERVRQIQNNALRKIRLALEMGYLAA